MKKELKGLYDLCKEKGLTDAELLPYFITIESNLKTKSYGLVWEEQLEDIASDLKNKFPILVEREDLSIKAEPNGLTNCLIEGDNYESLTFLKNSGVKVDCIYIDPPYNTGNKDFVYNDKYIDSEDTWRHSSWLSFMNKRLKLAKDLLTEDGVIFISIDDNEQAQLKLLCDNIFGTNNFIANLVWENKEGGGKSDSKFIRGKHEYVLVYVKNKISFIENKSGFNSLPIMDKDRYKLSDEHLQTRGSYQLQKLNVSGIRYSESLDYVIIAPDGSKLLANSNGKKEKTWRWSEKKLRWGIDNDFIVFKKDNKGIYQVYSKQYLNVDNENKQIIRGQKALGVINEFSTTQSSKQLKDIFNDVKVFDYTKPIELIKYLLRFVPLSKNFTILDFFAGSGTTGHAVLDLNKEDGGNRKFILCTNNEVSYQKELDYLKQIGKVNGVSKKELTGSYKEYQSKDDYVFFKESEDYAKLGICRSVTYERLKRVINGYTTPKGKEVEGIPSNLKYFKVENLYSDVNPMEIEDEVIDNIIPFIQFKHNVWGKETVVEDLIILTSEKEDIYVHMNKLYLCDGFYDSINNQGKQTVLYIYDGLFEILDAARLGNVKVVSIPSEFYKK